MAVNECPQCGAPNELNSTQCKYCGEALVAKTVAPPPQQQNVQQPVFQQAPSANDNVQYASEQSSGINSAWPIKSKVAAGLLGIFLGGLGIHKFYLGKIGMGILYLVLCWTYIPAIIGFIEGIIYLASDDHTFQVKHQVRLQ